MSNIAAAGIPSEEDAYIMGAAGGGTVEGERKAFEAWVRGHNWALDAEWDGKGYRAVDEVDGSRLSHAGVRARMMWAAWRDRAALARNTDRAAEEMRK